MLTTTILPVNVNIYAQNENISKFTFPKGFLESLQKDVSGHYSNPAFGIEDIVFPEGWHGRQILELVLSHLWVLETRAEM